jgi:outer membrane protein assembly factor BamB
MVSTALIFVGIRGCVLALDRTTGAEVWRTSLKGQDFVSVALTEGQLLAAARGELYCLDPATGMIRWHNPLKGLGWGLVSIADGEGRSAQVLTAEKVRQQKAAAAAAAASASS